MTQSSTQEIINQLYEAFEIKASNVLTTNAFIINKATVVLYKKKYNQTFINLRNDTMKEQQIIIEPTLSEYKELSLNLGEGEYCTKRDIEVFHYLLTKRGIPNATEITQQVIFNQRIKCLSTDDF